MAKSSVHDTLRDHGERISYLEKLANRGVSILEKILIAVVSGVVLLAVNLLVWVALGARLP